MKRYALLIIFAFNAYALDPMYNYRYTLGPEIVVPDASHASLGVWTYLNEDLVLSSNVQFGLTDKFEIGAKYIGGTNDEWVTSRSRDRNHFNSIVNVGAKYAIYPHIALQADVPVSLNRDMDWSGILTVTKYDAFARNVSFIYEGRVGFGEMVGDNSYVKTAASGSAYFQIGSAFRMSVTAVSSGSVGSARDLKDDFMVDVLPRIEMGFKSFRVIGEVAIAILTYNAEELNRYAVFVVSDM
ncbi:MAG: hypothetical protein LBC85_01685 [Fibromonadaceae bacterium]|jgi:hypothetical protein|nr:hypothetical protein [Fibromonadaceae bacterium]